jgi:taurine dioxygenase
MRGNKMATLARLAITPFDQGPGADVEGFDFHDPDPASIADVRQSWLEHGVLRFKRTCITDEDQLAFSRHFGDFVIHPKQKEEGAHPLHPEILVISNAMKDGRPSGAMGNSEATWHTDTWFYERPPAGAILRAIEVPPAGGNTYFLSTYDAYEALDSAVRRQIDGRQIFFQRAYDKTGRLRRGQTEPRSTDFREWDGVVHPLVRTHAETGRKALYLGGTSEGAWIVGMPLDESSALVRELWDHVESQPYFTQVWDRGDIMMWDNRCTMHRRDSFDPTTLRIMHRTTTSGERPI